MGNAENKQKLWELIGDIKFAMLTTQDEDGSLHSRPMTVLEQHPGKDELLFFTAVDAPKVDEIESVHAVNVSFAEPAKNRYVSVSGRAWVSQESELIDRLWSPLHQAWFPEGKESPRLAVLHVAVEYAEFWDAPSSKMVQVAGYVKALATGAPAKPGVHAKVRVERPPYPDTEYEEPAHLKDESSGGPEILEPIEESTD
jgi:general stress protein 26